MYFTRTIKCSVVCTNCGGFCINSQFPPQNSSKEEEMDTILDQINYEINNEEDQDETDDPIVDDTEKTSVFDISISTEDHDKKNASISLPHDDENPNGSGEGIKLRTIVYSRSNSNSQCRSQVRNFGVRVKNLILRRVFLWGRQQAEASTRPNVKN
ncbi:hypothetical protein FQR65_LT13025 [Abscondita terminalis]|nr:hypothetical protein FQR65_LT13025 [Abscondita terminalis]